MGSSSKDDTLKIVVVGEPRVGKTTSVSMYVERQSRSDYRPTIGTNLYVKKDVARGREIKIIVYDTAGQKSYAQVVEGAFSNVDGILAIYDLTRPETFDKLADWMAKFPNKGSDSVRLLVGNKMDLVNSPNIPEFAKNPEFCSQFADHRIVSALTGYNILETWVKLVNLILKKRSN